MPDRERGDRALGRALKWRDGRGTVYIIPDSHITVINSVDKDIAATLLRTKKTFGALNCTGSNVNSIEIMATSGVAIHGRDTEV